MSNGTSEGVETGDICPGCRQSTQAGDWTCPHCGRVLDRYLFSTVTRQSVSGADKDAFVAGYDACMSQWRESRSVEIGVYRPVKGHETAYRAGWRFAAEKLEGKAERSRGRRRGLVLLGSGVLLLAIGGAIMAVSSTVHITVLHIGILGLGALNVLLGLTGLITGRSDE